jgi:hypothetical protein
LESSIRWWIKAEYYWGVRSWWLFLLAGLISAAASLLVINEIVSILLGVLAFSCFWSIREIFQQKRRVEKGWFPQNPKRKNNFQNLQRFCLSDVCKYHLFIYFCEVISCLFAR